MYRRPSDEDFLALARMVAKVAHSGQTRRGGEDYFAAHVEPVAEYVREHRGLRAATLGYLHDTVEDTTVTREALLDIGFPNDLVHDVILLSHLHANEPYLHYVGRLIEWGSDDALFVKLTDIGLNLPGATDAKRELYLAAQQHILSELERRETIREIDALERAA